MSPEEQSLALGTVIQNLRTLTGETSPVERKSWDYVKNAIGLLYEVGTDEQIVAGLSNLSGFGQVEPDAAEVLASCKSAAGVAIVERLAEQRLSTFSFPDAEIGTLPDEERRQMNVAFMPFYFLLVRLEGATNPAGPRAALKLRDELAARATSHDGRLLTAELDEDLAGARTRKQVKRPTAEIFRSRSDSKKENVLNKVGRQMEQSLQKEQYFESSEAWIWVLGIALVSIFGLSAGLYRWKGEKAG